MIPKGRSGVSAKVAIAVWAPTPLLQLTPWLHRWQMALAGTLTEEVHAAGVPLFPPFPLCQEQLAWIADIRSALKLPLNFSPSRQNGKHRYHRVRLSVSWGVTVTLCYVFESWLWRFSAHINAICHLRRVFSHTNYLFSGAAPPSFPATQAVFSVNIASWPYQLSCMTFQDQLFRSQLVGPLLMHIRVKLGEMRVCRERVWSTCLRYTGVWETTSGGYQVSGWGKVLRWWVATFLVWEWRFV